MTPYSLFCEDYAKYKRSLEIRKEYAEPFYKDYDSLFERFAIMTVDGKLADSVVLILLESMTTPELLQQLKKQISM